MRIRLRIQKKLFLSHFTAVILVSGSIGSYFYLSAVDSLMDNLQSRLRYSAALISQVLDADKLDGINNGLDVAHPAYLEYLKLLRSFRSTNPDISYLYIMRKADDRISFVIDSDETGAQALPGKSYTNAPVTLLEGFERPAVDATIYIDEWGAFMSGYSPILNSNGRYLVGMDMRATDVHNKFYRLRMSGILSMVCSILLAIIFSRCLSVHFTSRIKLLIARCSAIADGRLDGSVAFRNGDELDNLINAFSAMSVKLKESQDQSCKAEEALRLAANELEKRVEDRTKELMDLNEKLKHEIAERMRVEDALAKAAKSDPLTGLLNRRAMLEHLEYEARRYDRNRTPFVVLLGDIDKFKDINDSYGHDVGDYVLRCVAGILRDSIRTQDLLARWGGEEFLILLPDTDLKGGLVVAEKLRSRLANEMHCIEGDKLKLTLSIGVADYSAGQTLNECIKAADMSLYDAKRRGRNRVEAAAGRDSILGG
jgi:diguanylate cyclase (GGDEF)-like protein